MSYRISIRRGVLAAVASVLLLLGVASSLPATTLASDEPNAGTVISSEPMTLAANLDAVATGKRITYVSTDPGGNAITVSGAVLTPRPHILRSHPRNASRTVAWAHGTMGLADHCAPSRTDHLDLPGFDDYSATVASYLSQGWTVAATDYPGLGTPGLHPYVVGKSEGRSIIDSVRAARKLNSSLPTNGLSAVTRRVARPPSSRMSWPTRTARASSFAARSPWHLPRTSISSLRASPARPSRATW